MGLLERLDEVQTLRGLSDRGWSQKAKLSERYVHVARDRAEKDPSYVLPEKGAQKLADAAQVSAEWLRFGRGARDVVATPLQLSAEAELAFYDALSRGGIPAEDGVAARGLVEAGRDYLPRDRAEATRAIVRLLESIARVRATGRPVNHDSVLWDCLGPSPPPAKATRAA